MVPLRDDPERRGEAHQVCGLGALGSDSGAVQYQLGDVSVRAGVLGLSVSPNPNIRARIQLLKTNGRRCAVD